MSDDHDLTDDELLTVPGEDIPPGTLTEFFTRRTAVTHQREMDELMLQLGVITRKEQYRALTQKRC